LIPDIGEFIKQRNQNTKRTMSTANNEIHIAVTGSRAVGKSTFSIQFVQNKFVDSIDPTMIEYYRKETIVDDKTYHLIILDWVSEHAYGTPSPYNDLKDQVGYLLLFSVTDRYSFDEINEIIEEIVKRKEIGKKYSMILIGNMSDLDAEREVSIDEAKNFAKDIGIPYIETSAKLGTNVDESFHQLIRSIQQNSLPKQTSDSRSTMKSKKAGCTLS
jgi:GTPase KRas protein